MATTRAQSCRLPWVRSQQGKRSTGSHKRKGVGGGGGVTRAEAEAEAESWEGASQPASQPARKEGDKENEKQTVLLVKNNRLNLFYEQNIRKIWPF